MRAILSLPYRWFTNVAALQEKRPFHVTTVFYFVVFVSIVRMLGEWLLAGNDDQLYVTDFVISIGFYWFCFFAYTFVLWLLVPQPWQRSMNVILVGIFLGIFPPIVDALVSGIGQFRYGFFWDFADFSPLLYNPAARVPLGESLTLWATIFLTGLYVGYRTRSLLYAAAGATLAWVVSVVNAALLPGAIARTVVGLDYPVQHRFVLITLSYFALTLVMFFLFQPRVFAGLLRRSIHALPFILITIAGAKFTGGLRFEIFVYASIVAVAFLAALAQNDWHDRDEDAAQGRPLYLDAQDVTFMNVVATAMGLTLMAGGSFTGLLVLLILTVSVLYSYPQYRAKRFFPSNLKIEGVWGGSAFLVGVIAQSEFSAFGHPAWIFAYKTGGTHLGALSAQTAWATVLVFGGYSLIAALKDYKDREADLKSGVQTLYTLARRRGWNEAFLHRALTTAACAALFAPVPLLAWIGRVPLLAVAGGLPAPVAVWAIAQGEASPRRFALMLSAISAQLVYVILCL